MTGTPEAAAQLDRAIDDLLRGASRPTPGADGELLATARLVWETLPRFHPRFGFSEALSRRLALAGQPAQPPPSPRPGHPGGERPSVPEAGTIVAFETLRRADGERPAAARADPAERTDRPDRPERSSSRRLGMAVAGGAIASGVSLAIPIAGAMLLRRRRARGSRGLA